MPGLSPREIQEANGSWLSYYYKGLLSEHARKKHLIWYGGLYRDVFLLLSFL